VIVVHLVLIIVLVTIDAREDTIIRGVVVAVRASVPFPIVVAAVDREELIIVVECRIAPIRFIVTLRAVGAETRSGVVRIVGAIVIGHMTGTTCGRRTGITVRMAFDASRGGVCTMQREAGIVVVESRIPPCRLIMAHRAIGAEARCGMVGIGRTVVFGHMTSAACGRCTGITVRMAFDASRCFVRTMQREVRYIMVERSGPSGSCGMARGTIRGEPGKLVTRVGGVLVVR